MMTTVALQFDEVIGLLANAGFVWTLLLATWGAVSYSFMRHRRHGPKVGPSQTAGAVSFSLTKPRLSEEEIFRILTTTETNIQIVRICETPRTAREISCSVRRKQAACFSAMAGSYGFVAARAVKCEGLFLF